MEPGASGRRIRVLHLILMLGETNGQYNQHCLPLIGVRDLSICTYFVPRLTPPPEIALFAGDGTLRGFFRALRAALDAKDYDVIHAHAPESGALLVFALVLWGRFRRMRRTLVFTVTDSFYDFKLRNQAVFSVILMAFERVIFCSRAAYDSFPRPWRWLVRGRWRVVQNGADVERVARVLAGASITRDPERFTVITIGRLERVKDPVTFLEAFAGGTDATGRLVVVGTGTLAARLAEKARDLGVADRVDFTGLIPRDEVYVRCAEADLFVSASLGEGLPVAVIEAMATGCPAILSDIPPHRELMDGTDIVPLVPTGDVRAFAREIRRYLEMAPAERTEMGRRCRDHVTARFTMPILHAGIESVYRELPSQTEATAQR